MRALIDWSYDLLGDAEKAVFRRVAVFAGGWTLEAAGEICSDDAIESWDVLDLLGALVDKSMVVAELADGEQRYRLLESTRQYASEKLGESGEREHLRGKHAAYYLALLREAEPSLNVTPMGTWIAPLAAETDNFRLALDWYLTDKTDPELGAELIALLIEVFSEISRPAELWRWLVVAHGALGESGDPALRARLLGGMSAISDAIGMGFSQRLELAQQALAIFRECGTTLDIARATVQVGLYYAFVERITEATPLFEEGLELARRTKDRRLIARALAAESYCLSDLEAKRQCLREATALYRAAGDDRGAARTQSWLAEQEFRFGDVGAALAHANESIAICRRRRFRSNLVVHLVNAAAYHLWIGAVDEARDAAREAIGICQEIQDLLDVPICIQHLAGVAQARGDAERAARLLGFTDARFLAIDEVRQMTEKRLYDRIVEALLGTLGADELRAHMAAGALLGEDEAIDEALRA
jgi:tetratricopeptide (TPR) repeat protein